MTLRSGFKFEFRRSSGFPAISTVVDARRDGSRISERGFSARRRRTSRVRVPRAFQNEKNVIIPTGREGRRKMENCRASTSVRFRPVRVGRWRRWRGCATGGKKASTKKTTKRTRRGKRPESGIGKLTRGRGVRRGGGGIPAEESGGGGQRGASVVRHEKMVIPSRMCPMHMHIFPQNGWSEDGGAERGTGVEERSGGRAKKGVDGGGQTRGGGRGRGGTVGGGNIEISNG